MIHLIYALPTKHVIYTVTSYPDYSNSNNVVTQIEITDPSINFYNLSLNSSKNEIISVIEQEGFKRKDSINDSLSYYKNNTIFSFYDSVIYISSYVSNKNGIIF